VVRHGHEDVGAAVGSAKLDWRPCLAVLLGVADEDLEDLFEEDAVAEHCRETFVDLPLISF
jgi:hypothetical protein